MPEEFIQHECVAGELDARLFAHDGVSGDAEERAAMMRAKRFITAILIAAGVAATGPAAAQEPVRIGVSSPARSNSGRIATHDQCAGSVFVRGALGGNSARRFGHSGTRFACVSAAM